MKKKVESLNKVEHFREMNAWSKSDLARKSAVAWKTISKMEQREKTGRLSKIKVARALGKNLNEVFPSEKPTNA